MGNRAVVGRLTTTSGDLPTCRRVYGKAVGHGAARILGGTVGPGSNPRSPVPGPCPLLNASSGTG